MIKVYGGKKKIITYVNRIVNCGRREILQKTAPHLVDSICAYRAGYVAEVSRLLVCIVFSLSPSPIYSKDRF